MNFSLSLSNIVDSKSFSQIQITDSPKFTLNQYLQDSQSNLSNQNLNHSEFELFVPELNFNPENQEKNCLKKCEESDLASLKLEQEKIENESMLIFQGQLNQTKKIPVLETFENKTNLLESTGLKTNETGKNLVFEHLKKMDFDEEESKEVESHRKNIQFDLFIKNASSQNLKSVESQSTRFNFNCMNLKNQNKKNERSNSSKLDTNLCFQIFNSMRGNIDPKPDQKSLNHALSLENHVNLKRVCEQTSQFQNSYNQFLQTLQKSNRDLSCLHKKEERNSLKSTGLRRKDVVFADFQTRKGKKTQTVAFVKLASLLEQTPELAREKDRIFGYINESLRSISMRHIYSPSSRAIRKGTRTSVRKSNRIKLFEKERSQMSPKLNLDKRDFDVFANSIQESTEKLSESLFEPDSLKQILPKTKKKKSHSKPKGGIRKIIQKIKKSSKKNSKKCGCRCKKTKCTRLHCICFREKGYCGDQCMCTDCYNREEFSETIKKIRDFTKEINPLAFQSKIETIGLENGQKIHNRGCSCTKNQCKKNYCECFKNGLACSPLCKCENCKNEKVEIDVSKVKEIFKKCSRKKKKFVIFLNKEKPTIKKIQI